ncbi:hypothetical protein VP01_34g9 [Puccinia sorghi]|uniref:Pseudouridine synthase RsuA/RluA-like domain-containing protein n=1 Tax=Puccinia sorghi TaxID=27349 RepID=A0A0L6UXN2_9BASI|nr:hypothetical protein VP01_34g9 [Puccinia sorghi]
MTCAHSASRANRFLPRGALHRQHQMEIHSSATKYDHKPSWYFQNGLRKVKPYLFEFSTFAKAHAVASGVIKINGKNIKKDVIIRNGDRITNILHRHEPPVTGDPVRILHRDDQKGLLVVEKPGSMPSVEPLKAFLTHQQMILKILYLQTASNRLDRLTSGVMVCALNLEASRGLSKYFSTEGAVKKEYIARCRGNFPEGEVVCEEPLLTIDRQIGLNVVHPEGKAWGPSHGKGGIYFASSAKTDQTNGSTKDGHPKKKDTETDSVDQVPADVEDSSGSQKRRPSSKKLGRNQRQGMSQEKGGKRVKLDPESAEAGNCSGVAINELASAVIMELRKARDIEDDFGRVKDTLHIDKAFKSPQELQLSIASSSATDEPLDAQFCPDCGIPLLPDPKPEQLYIYLHAFRYQTNCWDFSSPMPWWSVDEEWKARKRAVQQQ